MGWWLPYLLGGDPSEDRYLFEAQILDVVPPWLQERVGGAVLSSIGATADSLLDRARDGVRLRFPGPGGDESAIPYIGRDRRIIRAPGEDVATYAGRLIGWWEAHRRRGGVYALLDQLAAYYAAAPRRVDIVYHSGTRYVLEADGTITRDTITWNPDGTDQWAQVYMFFYEDTDPGSLTAAEEAALLAIPREWNAAHVLPIKVVILWPGVATWDYPPSTVDDKADFWTDDAPLEVN